MSILLSPVYLSSLLVILLVPCGHYALTHISAACAHRRGHTSHSMYAATLIPPHARHEPPRSPRRTSAAMVRWKHMRQSCASGSYSHGNLRPQSVPRHSSVLGSFASRLGRDFASIGGSSVVDGGSDEAEGGEGGGGGSPEAEGGDGGREGGGGGRASSRGARRRCNRFAGAAELPSGDSCTRFAVLSSPIKMSR